MSQTDHRLPPSNQFRWPRLQGRGLRITQLKGASGGGTTQNHNSFVDALSYWLGARARIPLQGGKYGKSCTCKGIFSGLTGLLQLTSYAPRTRAHPAASASVPCGIVLLELPLAGQRD
jgi:hypothetical protein